MAAELRLVAANDFTISGDTPNTIKPTAAGNEFAMPDNLSENDAMTNAVTHYELDAKLEAMEARADARTSRFEERIDQAIAEMRRDRADFKEEFKSERTERRTEMRGLKITIITTAIAMVVGLYAANISLVQTMVASFDSGKGTATAITQATEQMKQTQEQLKVIQERLDRQAATQVKK